MSEAIGKLIEQLSKLGFGFALGAGLGGILFIILNSIISISVSPFLFLYSGGAFGLGISKLLDKAANSALKPLTERIRFYFDLLEISWLKKRGIITKSTARKLSQKLICRRFIGEDLEMDEADLSLLEMFEPLIEEGLDINKKKSTKAKKKSLSEEQNEDIF